MCSLSAAYGWGSPIGIGVFMVSLAATIYLFARTIETLSKIDRDINPKK